MKKRLFGTLLMGAMFIASMSMFTSCKDYDDDINKNKDAISALQSTVSTLESKLAALESTHNKDIQDLNTKISALNAAIDKANNEHATKVELQNAVSALEKSIADLAAIAATKQALEEAQKLLDEKKADKTALEELQKTLAAADADLQLQIDGIKKVDEDQDIAIAAAQKQLENQAAAIEELKKALEGKADLAEFNKLKEVVAGNSELIAKNAENIAKNAENIGKNAENIGKNAAAIEVLQNKLAGIENVKKYIDDIKAGLEDKIAANADAIAVLRTDMNNADQKIREDLGNEIAILTLYVDKVLESIVLRPDNYIDGIEAIDIPMLVYQDKLFGPDVTKRGKAGEAYAPKAGKNTNNPDGPYHWVAGLEKFMPYLTAQWNPVTNANFWDSGISALTGNQYIHILPTSDESIEAVPNYYTYFVHAYYHVNPDAADLTDATFKWYTNYPNVTLAVPVATRADAAPETLIAPVDENLDNSMVTNGILDVPFKLDMETYVNTYAINFLKALIGAEGFTSNGKIEKYLGLDEKTMKIPFVAAQITKKGKSGVVRTVTSDYAAILPTFMQIVALADNNPDTKVAPTWDQLDLHKVEANHLYETANDAINGAATHEVKWDSEIDLKPFIETHFAHMGTSFGRDDVMSEQLFNELGLHYEYQLVDWTSNINKTEQSNHADEAKAKQGIIAPRAVDGETGKAIDKQSIESVGRMPILRVALMKEDNILKVGYIKVRIVKELYQPVDVDVTVQGDIKMNCSGEGVIKWHQIEAYVLRQLGLTKAEFDAQYELDVDNTGAGIRFVKFNGVWVNEENYVRTLANQYLNTSMTIDEGIKQNYDFARAYYSAFAGRVIYSADWWPIDDPSDHQTNVLIWNLGVDNSAHARTYDYGAGAIPSYIGTQKVDEAYVRYLAQPDANGISTKALSTTVRFVKKEDKSNPVYVTMTIPEKKIQWATGKLTNKKLGYWYRPWQNINVDSNVPADSVKDVHINVPAPKATAGYNVLDQQDFAKNLLQFFNDQTVKWDFSMNAWKNNQNQVEFYLTYPQKDINSNFDATNGTFQGQKAMTWKVKGFSGTEYTIALAKSKDGGKTFYTQESVDKLDLLEIGRDPRTGLYEIKNLVGEIQPVRRGNYLVTYDAVNKKIVPVVSLLDNEANQKTPAEFTTIAEKQPKNEFIQYYWNEAAEDILNYKSHKELAEGATFTAYVQATYNNNPCYEALDPTYSNYFNARFERPVNFDPFIVKVPVDAVNDGSVINFTDFIFQWKLDKNGKFDTPTITKTAFTDWRDYNIVPKALLASFTSKVVWGEYYTIELDGANAAMLNLHGTTPFANITVVKGGDPKDPAAFKGWKFTDDVRLMIKTDVGLAADQRVALTDPSKINALPFADKEALKPNQSLTLEVGTNGQLIYHNNGANLGNFHLYVPIFWSYVLGDEDSFTKAEYTHFRSSITDPGVAGKQKLVKGMAYGVVEVTYTEGN